MTYGGEPRRRALVTIVVVVAALTCYLVGAELGLPGRSPARAAPSATPSVPAVPTALADLLGDAQAIVAPSTRVTTFGTPTQLYDFWPAVDGDDIGVPEGLVRSSSQGARVVAFIGIGVAAFRRNVLARAYEPESLNCEAAYRALAPGHFPVRFTPAALALWITPYVHRPISDTLDEDATFEELYASTFAVLRYYPDEFARRVSALSPAARAAVRTFVRALLGTLDADSRSALTRVVPALASYAS